MRKLGFLILPVALLTGCASMSTAPAVLPAPDLVKQPDQREIYLKGTRFVVSDGKDSQIMLSAPIVANGRITLHVLAANVGSRPFNFGEDSFEYLTLDGKPLRVISSVEIQEENNAKLANLEKKRRVGAALMAFSAGMSASMPTTFNGMGSTNTSYSNRYGTQIGTSTSTHTLSGIYYNPGQQAANTSATMANTSIMAANARAEIQDLNQQLMAQENLLLTKTTVFPAQSHSGILFAEHEAQPCLQDHDLVMVVRLLQDMHEFVLHQPCPASQ